MLRLKFDRTTAFTAKWHSVSPKSSKCNISISNGQIAFKFYTEVKYLKLHNTNCQWLDYHPNCIPWWHFCIPQIFKMQYLHNQLSDCFKIWYRGKVLEATYKGLSMTRITPKLHSWRHFCIPQFFEMQYLHE